MPALYAKRCASCVRGRRSSTYSAGFASRLHAVLPKSAVVIGLLKAPVFAAFIALIGYRMGLSVTRDSRSVGQHTTGTVVQAIVWVITLDAAFAVALQYLGL
jgi:phospholipid/cholesterol/gamma-HCH transport system permease protein